MPLPQHHSESEAGQKMCAQARGSIVLTSTLPLHAQDGPTVIPQCDPSMSADMRGGCYKLMEDADWHAYALFAESKKVRSLPDCPAGGASCVQVCGTSVAEGVVIGTMPPLKHTTVGGAKSVGRHKAAKLCMLSHCISSATALHH